MSSDSRSKMVASAAALISARGVTATSFSDVVAASGAPRGSIYHHFPDGKRQLAEDAVRWTAARVLAFQRAGGNLTAPEVLQRFIGMWRNVVVASGATAGCVVAGVAVDTPADHDSVKSTDPAAVELLTVVRQTFADWITLLTEQLVAAGVPAGRAGSLATTVLAGMEGALILCRAEGSVAPLDTVAGELMRLLPG